MGIRGFATINHYVDDVAAAARWYADVFGIEPYYNQPGPDGSPAYIEFRVGDDEDEIGFIDRRFGPPALGSGVGGAVMHWHVDDLAETLARLLDLGATELLPVTEHAPGFVTASVVDPFGNILGIMSNAHYEEMLARR